MVPPLALAGGLAAVTVALHFRDPHEKGTWGLCPTAALGFSCPGCGGLRAVNDLTNLDLGAAASSNLVFVLSIPLLLLAFGRWSYGRWTGRPWEPSPRAMRIGLSIVAVVLAVFTVARNTPAGAWLAP
ncbi:DUF2752 domain-containing protein [Nocardioides sp. W3-2-3]|nr:DUF2752 domain-containing protein [Nocardioides convexus]